MLEVLLPDGGATIIRNGQILEFNLRALVEATACHTERSEERIYESLIQMDDEIATVWDPLIRIDGTSRWSGHVMNSSFTAGSTISPRRTLADRWRCEQQPTGPQRKCGRVRRVKEIQSNKRIKTTFAERNSSSDISACHPQTGARAPAEELEDQPRYAYPGLGLWCQRYFYAGCRVRRTNRFGSWL